LIVENGPNPTVGQTLNVANAYLQFAAITLMVFLEARCLNQTNKAASSAEPWRL
jgi:hypothetical protein